MLKKFVSLVLVILMLASFTACEFTLPMQKPAEPAEKTFETGKITSNSYESEFLGIGCRLESPWVFKTEAEMMQTNKEALALVGDDYANAIDFTVNENAVKLPANELGGSRLCVDIFHTDIGQSGLNAGHREA